MNGNEWERIKSHSNILQIVRNALSINLESIPHKCSHCWYLKALEEASVTDNEIKKLPLKIVIIPTKIEKQDLFSNTFTRLKTDETYRVTLHLKTLKLSVNAPHLKWGQFIM